MYIKQTHTQSTKPSSEYLLVGSNGFLPVMSSKSMTPNEKTSDLSVNFPLCAYSGAKYLQSSNNDNDGNPKIMWIQGLNEIYLTHTISKENDRIIT